MDTPLIDNSEPTGLGTRLRARKRYFWWAVTIVIIGLIDCIVFMIWRRDKPFDNPGGPLAIMGTAVVLWEMSGRFLMVLATFLLSVGQFRNRREP